MSKTLGAILIVLGLIGILWGGFTYTTQKKVFDLGPLEATHQKTHTVPVPPIAGAVALIVGAAFLLTGKRS
jgi:drug/metabolite transporter (DMT)-like permease